MKKTLLRLCLLLTFALVVSTLFGPLVQAADENLKEILPGIQTEKKAVESPHFPDRLHTFIWRNWSVVEAQRLAEVLDTPVENVTKIARSMGLPEQGTILPEWKDDGYITILRRNWHLLPYEQLLVLLDKTPEELNYCLREDDFLFIKLGSIKPYCEPLKYTEPDEKARARAAEIKKIVETELGPKMIAQPEEEPRFSFVTRLSRPVDSEKKTEPPALKEDELRFIYSYFATFGDPLMDDEIRSFPEGLLERLAASGVNGVWIHTVLRTLAPSEQFPELGEGHEHRLANLRKLVERARKYGIGVYLYVNEPRAMEESFFKKHPQIRGVEGRGLATMCTSTPEVRKWLSDSLAYVFKNVPHLGGVFTITASENLTSCASHGLQKKCPHCKDRTRAEIIAEVNATIEEGVHRGNPDAKVLVWDWGWPDNIAPEIISRLPKSCWFMSVSEWSLPIERGGVKGRIGEYSISTVGPGPRATKHWKLAKEAGLKTVAKVQLNNTWEFSAVPYLPTLDLIAEHASNLTKSGVNGMMLSWSLGGHPSPNLEVASLFAQNPKADKEAVLNQLAVEMFGTEGAPAARKAWTAFSDSFREFPYGSVLYNGPQHKGPANPLYLKPTGYSASMVGIPYDHISSWRGHYPNKVFIGQFEKMAQGWRVGLESLARAVEKAPADQREEALAQLHFAEAVTLHFDSVAQQAIFTDARDRLLAGGEKLDAAKRAELEKRMRDAATREIELAKQHLALCRQESRIGYEASNHYFYVPIDLAEKVINCRWILDQKMDPSEK